MSEIGSYEAKTHLPKLLERVANGERITITKHGVPVAMLVPVGSRSRRRPRETITEMRRFRRGRRIKSDSLKRMIEKGRR